MKSMNKESSPSFIKMAMKNMVKKSNKSLQHFFITVLLLFSFILLVAILGKPNMPAI